MESIYENDATNYNNNNNNDYNQDDLYYVQAVYINVIICLCVIVVYKVLTSFDVNDYNFMINSNDKNIKNLAMYNRKHKNSIINTIQRHEICFLNDKIFNKFLDEIYDTTTKYIDTYLEDNLLFSFSMNYVSSSMHLYKFNIAKYNSIVLYENNLPILVFCKTITGEFDTHYFSFLDKNKELYLELQEDDEYIFKQIILNEEDVYRKTKYSMCVYTHS